MDYPSLVSHNQMMSDSVSGFLVWSQLELMINN